MMIARSQPVGIKRSDPTPLPAQPQDDTERVKVLAETVRRHLIAIAKVADELDRIAARQEREAA